MLIPAFSISRLPALLFGHGQIKQLPALVALLREWTEALGLKRLGDYGVLPSHVDRIVANARGNSMLTNPVLLTDEEIAEIVRARL